MFTIKPTYVVNKEGACCQMNENELLIHPIRKFIIDNIRKHPADITKLASDKFNVSRQAILRHLNLLIDEGLILARGKTRGRTYEIAPIKEGDISLLINDDLKEDEVWREKVRPLLEGLPRNVLTICQYGFTEILNNAIVHSEGDKITIWIKVYPDLILLVISDDGIGIFNKIKNELGLSDRRYAILELTKGKTTTDPKKHTGEGIFFTSRSFDSFAIRSSDLFFSHLSKGDDWLIEAENSGDGTAVFLEISPNSTRDLQEVFDRFTAKNEEFSFSRTHVPVALTKYGDENLVSRSQARRLLNKFERFKEVFLNFEDVETIGQAFADEIFRVFANENPNVDLLFINANKQVTNMILRAKNQ
jgi:anti-sigma regulatory factor (Ser/Thr protein kinase)